MLFDGEVPSVYLSGDEGEYELLPYHFPILGALPEGEVKIGGHDPIPLRAGVVLFQENTCIIVIEEYDRDKARKDAERKEAEERKKRKRWNEEMEANRVDK